MITPQHERFLWQSAIGLIAIYFIHPVADEQHVAEAVCQEKKMWACIRCLPVDVFKESIVTVYNQAATEQLILD